MVKKNSVLACLRKSRIFFFSLFSFVMIKIKKKSKDCYYSNTIFSFLQFSINITTNNTTIYLYSTNSNYETDQGKYSITFKNGIEIN